MRRAIALGLGALVVAALVVLSGVISVKASSGHFAATAWVLDLVKRRSVAVRAIGIETPSLDEPSLVRLGAAHFERGCRGCHGAPGEPRPAVPARMTPHPPDLAGQVGRWRSRELFYLVAHGVKLTGMPAWPSPGRTDEAWAVVAFLQRLPGLDRTAYRQLSGAEDVATSLRGDPALTVAGCVVCHDGESPLVPRLIAQSPDYLTAALEAYAEDRRFSGIMQPIAAALDPPVRRQLADALAGIDAVAAVGATPPLRPTLVLDGDPVRDVPACAECHGPSGQPRDPRYPTLAGQSAAYLRLQLRLFAEGRRGGSPAAEIMRPIARRLSTAQIDAAADAFAAMPGVR
jgi:cytochrome c553